MLCKSFPPVINKDCSILILGSMPGVKSLTDQEYYAHPQNRFWALMQRLLADKNEHLTYAEKKQLLLQNHIVLWDTLAYCERNGSLDSNIFAEQPNDVLQLLQKYPKLTTIICNGSKAGIAFKKYFVNKIQNDVKVYFLHSTSPANARMTLSDLVAEWSKVIK